MRCKAVKWFWRQDEQVGTMHKHSRTRYVFTVFWKWRFNCEALQWFRRKGKQVRTIHRRCRRSKASAAEEAKQSKANAEEAKHYSLCLRRLSRAKFVIYCILECPDEQSIVIIYCVWEGSSRGKYDSYCILKAQSSKAWYVQCFRRVGQAKT